MRKRPLLMLACVFLLGICWTIKSNIWILAALAGLCLYSAGHLREECRWCRMLVRVALLLLVFVLGASHMQLQLMRRATVLGQLENGETVTIQGEISKKQEKKEQYDYELQDVSVVLSKKCLPCGRVRVSFSSDIYPIGTILILQGKVNMFSEATNEGNFDQQQFYQSQGINFELQDACVRSTHGSEDVVGEGMYQLRRRLSKTLFQLMGEENAGVLSGMLLGDRSQIDTQIKADYQNAGISHLLAISALHISIFAMGMYRLLRRRVGGFLGPAVWAGIFIELYAIMTGNSISTRRAVAMFLVMAAGSVVGRSYDMLNALGLWILLALVENPFLIGYSGFVFSVTAVLGIGVTVRLLESGIAEPQEHAARRKAVSGKTPCTRLVSIKKHLVSGIGIQITTLPLVAFYYFEIPTYALFLNLLVIPLMSVVLISGAMGVFIGSFCINAGKLFILPADGILTIYHKLCQWALNLPYSQVIVGQPSAKKLLVYYLFLGLLMLLQARKCAGRLEEKTLRLRSNPGRTSPQKCAAEQQYSILKKVPVYAGFVCLVLFLYHGKAIGQEMDLLDVGQGLGIFFSTGDGNTCFIDGGSTSERSVGIYKILPFLKAKGVSGIDYWFISHADEDHISGAEEIFAAGYPVRHLILAEAMPKDDAYEKLVELARAAGTDIIYMDAGERLRMENGEIICLFPASGKEGAGSDPATADRNKLSLTLLLRTEGMSCLFPGDISSEEEEKLLDNPLLQQVDVYVAAHHGSRYSNAAAYLEMLRPQIAIVSCGLHNTYGHPGTEAVKNMQDAGAEIYYTMKQGRIRVQPDGTGRLVTDGYRSSYAEP